MAGRPWWAANELLAFLLEVVALGCLFRWGFSLTDRLVPGLLLGCAVLAAAATLWGLFAAPRARFRPPLAGVLAVKALVLGGSALALYGVGHPTAAAVMGVVVVANTALAETFRRRTAPTG
ncbi:YrdB family protein [Streptomyces sp. NBC_00525]|uniref:YrdB family protein n=1 Tax=Streptomyces sp. NBC_00525 TaxID=2903660 RepID=UPI002E8210FC|nr:YrdB family protein [Streptomyces sp. NBC_00525]WUC97856.1 YrdB family protein [Streptomyces sp. NBC_00525]